MLDVHAIEVIDIIGYSVLYYIRVNLIPNRSIQSFYVMPKLQTQYIVIFNFGPNLYLHSSATKARGMASGTGRHLNHSNT